VLAWRRAALLPAAAALMQRLRDTIRAQLAANDAAPGVPRWPVGAHHNTTLFDNL
jgi:hypothetical protein